MFREKRKKGRKKSTSLYERRVDTQESRRDRRSLFKHRARDTISRWIVGRGGDQYNRLFFNEDYL